MPGGTIASFYGGKDGFVFTHRMLTVTVRYMLLWGDTIEDCLLSRLTFRHHVAPLCVLRLHHAAEVVPSSHSPNSSKASKVESQWSSLVDEVSQLYFFMWRVSLGYS